MLNCEDMKLNIQALADNELSQQDIAPTVEHIKECYSCRREYISTLKLIKGMNNLPIPEPKKEWYEKLVKNWRRSSFIFAGLLLIFSSIIGSLVYFFFSSSIDWMIKIFAGASIAGLLILLATNYYDRFIENKEDKYKGIQK